MSEASDQKDAPRLEQIVDMLTRLAAGDMEARLAPAQGDDRIEVIITGLNMFAEELSSTLQEEARLRETLELRVEEKTAELTVRLGMIEEQGKTILELSTPALQVWDGVLALPLIGAIDTRRANQITENVLEGIEKTQASVVILDITGVPMIDTAVADHLLKTIRSARLLGAEVVLTGVSSQNALTIVRLGVDMGEIITSGTLQSGLKKAMQIRDQKL